MNSLTVNNRLPQLRAIPVQGTPSFRYERMVSGRWVPCTGKNVVIDGAGVTVNLTNGGRIVLGSW